MLRLALWSRLHASELMAHCEKSSTDEENWRRSTESKQLPTRSEALKSLKTQKEFDVLIVGGGATGSGAALDAARRGLSVACVEKEDFASGTSSRSTKLLWGGSRYLVQAFVSLFNFDLRLLKSPVDTVKNFVKEFKMVMSCHRERKFLLQNQPHLTQWTPIAVPLKDWLIWPPPFNYPPAALGPLGLFPVFFKFYDALSGFSCPPSHIMSPDRAKRKFPQLANNDIKYCVVFYEGMHDDARTNLAIAQTAAVEGATMANYVEVTSFIHDGDDHSKRVVGARVRDTITGEDFEVRAKSVLLCGGPFTDSLRKLEDADCKPAVTGAAGIHIVLPSYYAPSIGLVDMNTSDGRFLFFLPWNNHVIIGTTDHKCAPTLRPVPEEAEIKWLLNEASKYLSPELRLRRKDVLSAWAGIRPLATDPHAANTASASRDHVISHNPETGVTFVSGGKWTTFREMAEDAIDKVIEKSPVLRQKEVKPCSTLDTHFIGYKGWSSNLHIRLVQEYELSPNVARRLADAYGGRAHEVIAVAKGMGPDACEKILVPGFPILEAEVIFATRYEWAVHPEDFLARRSRLAFLNKAAAMSAIPKVVELMANELKWSDSKKRLELTRCIEYMRHIGGPTPLSSEQNVRMATETDLKHAFREFDVNKIGYLSTSQIPLVAEILHHPLTDEELADLIEFAQSAGNTQDRISFATFSVWWNSERLNPGLVELRKHKMATADQLEGPGAVFG